MKCQWRRMFPFWHFVPCKLFTNQHFNVNRRSLADEPLVLDKTQKMQNVNADKHQSLDSSTKLNPKLQNWGGKLWELNRICHENSSSFYFWPSQKCHKNHFSHSMCICKLDIHPWMCPANQPRVYTNTWYACENLISRHGSL